jgi:hypothetical protein
MRKTGTDPIFLIAALAAFAGCTPPETSDVVCTMEAKACPDGSYVGRDPDRNCAFKPCPK